MAAHEGAFMKTHSNKVVVLAHIQLKSFYRLSTHDITHVRKCTRPSPLYRTASERKLGEGLGTRLVHVDSSFSTLDLF